MGKRELERKAWKRVVGEWMVGTNLDLYFYDLFVMFLLALFFGLLLYLSRCMSFISLSLLLFLLPMLVTPVNRDGSLTNFND